MTYSVTETVSAVTERLIMRSKSSRARYLERMDIERVIKRSVIADTVSVTE